MLLLIEKGRLKIIFQTTFDTKFCGNMTQVTFAADCITAWFGIIQQQQKNVCGVATHAAGMDAGYGLLSCYFLF